MSSNASTASDFELPWDRRPNRSNRRAPHLVLAWSLDEPERIGEAFAVDRTVCLGRGAALTEDPAPRGRLVRMRPDVSTPCTPIANARISRIQLVLEPIDERTVRVRSVGRAAMRINGRRTDEGVASVDDVIELHNAAIFLVSSRLAQLTPRGDASGAFVFGGPDPFGFVGESEAAWRLRNALGFAAATDRHVLLMGESGAGKELAARAIHGLSSRSARPLVARNAATMPETLLDAELFGNTKNYPNPGMPERAGLIGEAHGSTLFLDEIGDLPESHQVHLLRVLDRDGEYQRLGESNARRSSFRLVAATNRAADSLKHDFLARFTHRIEIPGLGERREDVALLLSHLLRQAAEKTPAIASRFFEQRAKTLSEPRIAPELIARLLRHPFTHHVRELERLLWLAIGTAEGDYLGVTPAVLAELRDSEESATETTEIDRDTLQRTLRENDGSPTRAAKALGLKNRYVLIRLLKKYGLSARGDSEGDE